MHHCTPFQNPVLLRVTFCQTLDLLTVNPGRFASTVEVCFRKACCSRVFLPCFAVMIKFLMSQNFQCRSLVKSVQVTRLEETKKLHDRRKEHFDQLIARVATVRIISFLFLKKSTVKDLERNKSTCNEICGVDLVYTPSKNRTSSERIEVTGLPKQDRGHPTYRATEDSTC